MGRGSAQSSIAGPSTERGRRTRRKLLDAATLEFGENGFHQTSVSEITRRAGVALGSFYTYFETKDEIFKALVRDLSDGVRTAAAERLQSSRGALETERDALAAFLHFAWEHQEIYRIIDEAEFVDPESYRTHYEQVAARILARLEAGRAAGELRDDLEEAHAWAIMGMNVFLGLRYTAWAQGSPDLERVAALANSILTEGIATRETPSISNPSS